MAHAYKKKLAGPPGSYGPPPVERERVNEREAEEEPKEELSVFELDAWPALELLGWML